MTIEHQSEKKVEPKLYKCDNCGKKVVLDDYNAYFKICYKCEQKSGNILSS